MTTIAQIEFIEDRKKAFEDLKKRARKQEFVTNHHFQWPAEAVSRVPALHQLGGLRVSDRKPFGYYIEDGQAHVITGPTAVDVEAAILKKKQDAGL